MVIVNRGQRFSIVGTDINCAHRSQSWAHILKHDQVLQIMGTDITKLAQIINSVFLMAPKTSKSIFFLLQLSGKLVILFMYLYTG